jgi:hypothetical protein
VITKDDSVKALMRRLQAQRRADEDEAGSLIFPPSRYDQLILDMAKGILKEPGVSEDVRDIVALGVKHLERGLAQRNSDNPDEVREAAWFMMVGAFFIGSRTLGYNPRRAAGGRKGAASRIMVKTMWQAHVRARVAAICGNDPRLRGNRKGRTITKMILDEEPPPKVRLPRDKDVVYEFVLAELKVLK